MSLSCFRSTAIVALLLPAVALVAAGIAWACPFCSAVSMTLTEEINAADAAVIARLAGEQPEEAELEDGRSRPVKVKFDIVEVLKGKELLEGTEQIEVLYFGQDDAKPEFLITGIDPQALSWATPIGLSERAGEYVRQLSSLPESGGDRLAFFQEYFEDEDPLLAADAYDEFAKAPYADVKDLRDRMHHDKLIAWIQDPEVTASHRRLYLTMLGVCGSEEDVDVLEQMITSDDRQMKTALDAIVACYLTLKGPDGLPLVEDRFLKNMEAEYTDIYAVIMALRFHGQEEDIIPKERLVKALGHMLDRPQYADLVIPDLARWEDWSVMERLVELFKNADEDSSWVRVPVINYLRACPLEEAETYLAELEQIDPDAVKRARIHYTVAGSSPPPPPPTSDEDPSDDETSGEAPVEDVAASEPALVPPPAPDAEPPAEAPAEAPRAEANEQEGTATAAATAPAVAAANSPGGEGKSASDSNLVLFVVLIPVAAGVLLLAVLVIILRGQRGRVAT